MISRAESLIGMLSGMQSCVEFCPDMLPDGVSIDRILGALDFLSPIVIILHGSTVSHKKFSAKKTSDIDMVCVSIKAAFWPLEQLHKKINENLGNQTIKIDLSIVTYNGFLSLVKDGSSLSKSFSHGFSILYYEEKT
jgi:hypothetical protein